MSNVTPDPVDPAVAAEPAAEPAAEVVPAGEPIEPAAEPTEPATHAKAVLEYVVKAVVSKPEAVSVAVSRHRSGTVALDVSVARPDMGRVIGKRGRVAHAIRAVVKAAATRDGVPVEVEFLE